MTALFFGLNMLMGSAFALHPHWIYGLVLFFLWYKRSLHQLLLGVALLLATYLYTHYRTPPPFTQGPGILTIDSVQPFSSPFNRSLLYRAHFNGVPCLFFKGPVANCDYFVEGELQTKDHGPPIFKPKGPFTRVPGTWSIAQWRYEQKEKLRTFLYKQMPDQKAAHFLASLLTGDIDNRELSLEFRKVGLSHLLAISGLDFALLAAFGGWLLRRFLPPRPSTALLLLLITGYFFFLGVTPSILRAYVAAALYLVGLLFNLQTRGLNLLGAALIAELLYDPFTINNPGFQLTFLCTLGLLLFYRPIDALLCHLLPKRSLTTLTKLPFFHQHIALLAGLTRQSLAITLSAQLLALPVCLYHFHVFPLMSLLYNLFFPFGSGLALLLCFLGLTLGPLGAPIHYLNSQYTGFLLRLIASPPPLLDFKLVAHELPFALIIALISSTVWLTERGNNLHNLSSRRS